MATAGTALALVAAAMTTGTASAMSGGTEAPDPHETPWPAAPAVVDGPSVLCAGAVPGQPVQGCFGDSGGPAVVRDEQGEPRLAGIFSFGMETADLPCGAPGINAFADVTSLKGHPMG